MPPPANNRQYPSEDSPGWVYQKLNGISLVGKASCTSADTGNTNITKGNKPQNASHKAQATRPSKTKYVSIVWQSLEGEREYMYFVEKVTWEIYQSYSANPFEPNCSTSHRRSRRWRTLMGRNTGLFMARLNGGMESYFLQQSDNIRMQEHEHPCVD